MRAAVTVCLVPEARQGPFVFHGGSAEEALEVGCRRAAALMEMFADKLEEKKQEVLMLMVKREGVGV